MSTGRPDDARTVILYVEDDENDVFFARRAFSRATPEVLLSVVSDGLEAESYLAGEGAFADRAAHPLPALVVMDLKLPKKTGLEVLEWMRGKPELRTIPVVFLSSSTERGDIERAYRLGANAYLSKRGDLQGLEAMARAMAAYARTADPAPFSGFPPPDADPP
jgi:CheY-like chemotaxis protein